MSSRKKGGNPATVAANGANAQPAARPPGSMSNGGTPKRRVSQRPDSQPSDRSRRDRASALRPSRLRPAYVVIRGSKRTPKGALPKPECLLASEGWRHCSARSEKQRAPVPAGAQTIGFVKSMAINLLDCCLAQLRELTIARVCKKHHFRRPRPKKRFLNGIRYILRKVGLGLSRNLL